ncbi:DUF2155 domain-containing protein [Palleronia rufa]
MDAGMTLLTAGALLGLVLWAGSAPAQEIIPGAEDLFSDEVDEEQLRDDWENGVLGPLGGDVTTEESDRVEQAGGAVLRGLDKLTGDVGDLEVAVGETAEVGRLQVTLGECRYPVTDPNGNAYAYLVIREPGAQQPSFAGWMIADSPALNALEHPRYDIWVMRCRT